MSRKPLTLPTARWMSPRLNRAVAVGMTAATVVAFFWPSDQLPRWTVLSWDKLIHVGVFFVVTVAWLRTGISVRAVWALMVSLVLVSEVGQSVLPIGRYGDPFDALADLAGIAAAMGSRRWLLR
jgi:VanZ family protein